ncbi:paraquat-inducible protein A [Gynuella sunshinyii]|nr:paraquat-inducible protein A [Gynuella sunshinyii]
MRTYPHLTICEYCDRVYSRRILKSGEIARCYVCDAVLYRSERLDLMQWLALVIATLFVFLMANFFPVIRISFQGLQNEITLWQSVAVFMRTDVALIAVPILLVVIVIPAIQISLLLWLLAFSVLNRQAPFWRMLIKLLIALKPWSMIDVCMLGILVAVVKLSGYLDVAAGMGLWATAVLTWMMTLITNKSFEPIWLLQQRLYQKTSEL